MSLVNFGGPTGQQFGGQNQALDTSTGKIVNTAPTGPTQVVGSPFGSFSHWLPYMVLMGGVLLMVSQSPKYAPLGLAFGGVIAGGYLLINYNGVVTGFNDTFTTALPPA